MSINQTDLASVLDVTTAEQLYVSAVELKRKGIAVPGFDPVEVIKTVDPFRKARVVVMDFTYNMKGEYQITVQHTGGLPMTEPYYLHPMMRLKNNRNYRWNTFGAAGHRVLLKPGEILIVNGSVPYDSFVKNLAVCNLAVSAVYGSSDLEVPNHPQITDGYHFIARLVD